MKSTAEEIEAALANYRRVTAERNRRELQVFVDAIVGAGYADEETAAEFTEEEMDKERMGQVADLVEDELDFLAGPAELMGRYDELAARLRLDGTVGGDLDPEARARSVEPFFQALESALKEKAPADVREIISAPEEFRVLGRHVTGICGPGLPHEQTMYPKSLWTSEGGVDHATISSRILSPEDTNLEGDFGGRIALGWEPGTTIECQWICVFVQEEDGSWTWKFVYCEVGQTQVFDTIPDLLEWFLRYTEEGTPLLEGVTAEVVIDRGVWDLKVRRSVDEAQEEE
ncbi:hypothetical protein KVR01_011663 [Diaporthe batatas]|uniref:uncharacterized protein n=1 Tax=Diaporthe batatas TaxID=748121 RepID=UPI001D0497FC|nr:uncharacterized protein KVR01_011663 [Diaporthe batatas]KAG8158541.1 hypothetical protein KVR01_011663 [Diaporthe batatas]